AELLDSLRQDRPRAVCLVSVHSGNAGRLELLCRRIRESEPDAYLLVGLWDPSADNDRLHRRLMPLSRVRNCPTLATALQELDSALRLGPGPLAVDARSTTRGAEPSAEPAFVAAPLSRQPQ